MSDLIDSEKCRRNLECGVCSALISENPENARTRSHSFPEFSYIEDCVENKIQFTRKIPHGVTTKSMLFCDPHLCVLFAVLFQLEPSSFAFRTFSAKKKKHNVGPSASTTITTTLVSVHYMFKEAI
jgi:hypothetical protein